MEHLHEEGIISSELYFSNLQIDIMDLNNLDLETVVKTKGFSHSHQDRSNVVISACHLRHIWVPRES